MRRQEALVIGLSASVVEAAALYLARPPAPVDYPLQHTLRWAVTPGIAMHWYGRSLMAIGGGVATLLVARLLLPRFAQKWDTEPPPWLPRALAVITLATLVFALGHTVVHEYRDWMTR